MKFRRSWKSILAAVLSAAFTLGAVSGLAPVKASAEAFTPATGTTYIVAVGSSRDLVFVGSDDQDHWGLDNTATAYGFVSARSVSADTNTYTVTLTIPANTVPGDYTLTVTDEAANQNYIIRVVAPEDPAKDPTGKSAENSGEDPALRTLPPTGPDGHQHDWHWEYGSTYHCSICNTFYTVYPAHDHQYEWYVTKPATETDDGEAHHMCKICGSVDLIEPVGAYYLFSQNAENKINKAPIGGTVNVETTRWLSFQGYVLEALAKRPDVTLNVTFRENGYKGGEVKTVTIPAGYDAASLKDANGYCGFKYLAGVFGAN